MTPYIYEHPQLFRLLHVKGEEDYSNYRWTVDMPEDLVFVRAVYERLRGNEPIRWKDVVDLLERDPSLTEINRNVRQKALMEC